MAVVRARRVATGKRPAGVDLSDLLREEVVAYDAAMRLAFRLPAVTPDDILTTRGIETYDKMMTDAVVRASINTKRYALLANPWTVEPGTGPNASRARDFVEWALNGLTGPDGSARDFRQALFQMMSAFYRGFSLGEMVWRMVEAGPWRGRIALRAIKFKSPKQIGFELDEFMNVRAVTSLAAGGQLVTVPRGKCLLYVHNPKDEMPYGDSDLRPVYKHWFSKQRLIEMWNLRLQRYGIPLAYANMGSGSDAASQRVLDILQQFQQESSAVFPQHVQPHILETRGEGGGPFETALEWHDNQIAHGILLQTLTSGEGRHGTQALGAVHFDVLLFALECAKRDIEAAVNSQVVRPLVDLNFGGGEYPVFRLGEIGRASE